MQNHLIVARLLIVMIAVVAAPLSPGWTSHGTWADDTFTMRASIVSFPTWSPYRGALQTVADRFNNNPGDIRVTQLFDDVAIGFNNGQSEVWASRDRRHRPAICYTWYNVWGRVVEADVVIWTGGNYTSSMNKTTSWTYGGDRRTFETTALHEYGHAGGLGHENDEYNIMGEDWTHVTCNGTTLRSYLGEDACDGLHDLYGPASGSIEDLSITIMKRIGRDGEYSTHGTGVLRDLASGGLLTNIGDYEGQPRWRVSPGQRITAEFTLENNGKTTQAPRVGIYLSDNSTISTADRLLATATLVLTRDNVLTYAYAITIPSDLGFSTTHYLGAYIDDDFQIAEVDTANNAAYHVIYVR